MKSMKHAMWLVATGLTVMGLLKTGLAGQEPAPGSQGTTSASQAGASRAERLEKERDNAELQKVPPFRVFDNLYYVGVGWVGSWLVTTNQGLILIDAVEERYADHLLDSVRKVGFDPKDIKYLIVAQAHFDHYGGAARIQETYGAKVAMGEEDWNMVAQVAQAGGRGAARARAPRRDIVIKDGDTLTLGNTTLTLYATPGHTPGTTSVDFTVYDAGKPYRAFLFGGAAPAAGVRAAEQFVESVNRLERLQEGVQVRVVNHPWMDPNFWDRADRLAQRKPGEPHPFVAPEVFRAWVQELKAAARKQLEAAQEKKG